MLAPTYVASGVGGKPTVQFAAVNVQILNGASSTNSKNGEGNLVLGYDESAGTQTGSHDLVLGSSQTFTGAGDVVGGFNNTVSGLYAAAFGYGNTVSGAESLAAGDGNQATATTSSVLGGYKNKATTAYSSILGGCSNLIGTGTVSVSSLCTDTTNHDKQFATISGGAGGQTTGIDASISGGDNNTASGSDSAVSGGEHNTSSATGASILGDSNETEDLADAAAGVFQQHFPISIGSATIAGSTCLRSTLSILGTQTGDIPMWTKTTTDLPSGMLFEPERITGSNQVQGDFCNVSGSTLSEPGNEAYTYESLH